MNFRPHFRPFISSTRTVSELHAMADLCLAQADKCELDLASEALRTIAENYRRAAEAAAQVRA